MRKTHVTLQVFEASGRHGDLFEKTKNTFLDKVNGSMCAKFQVCIVFRLASEIRNILDRLLPSRGFLKIEFFVALFHYPIIVKYSYLLHRLHVQ